MKEDIRLLVGLAEQLEKLGRQNKTGVIFVVSGDHRSAQLSFLDGQPVFALCQGKKGQEVINIISRMPEVRFRFQEGVIPPTRVKMPSLEELVAVLRPDKDGTKSVATVCIKSKEEEGALRGLAPKEKSLVEEILTDCIGPMAAFLCEERLGDVDNLEEAVDRLREELPYDLGERFRDLMDPYIK